MAPDSIDGSHKTFTYKKYCTLIKQIEKKSQPKLSSIFKKYFRFPKDPLRVGLGIAAFVGVANQVITSREQVDIAKAGLKNTTKQIELAEAGLKNTTKQIELTERGLKQIKINLTIQLVGYTWENKQYGMQLAELLEIWQEVWAN